MRRENKAVIRLCPNDPGCSTFWSSEGVLGLFWAKTLGVSENSGSNRSDAYGHRNPTLSRRRKSNNNQREELIDVASIWQSESICTWMRSCVIVLAALRRGD
jgi:hypothetical protein